MPTVPFQLSDEQENFIACALTGENILVDACIGSGKTTAIQELCNRFPADKKILYLTYNHLLKLDAQARIKNKNVTVTNYHGFAAIHLGQNGISAGVAELITTFLQMQPSLKQYDVLIIDEYQDIEQEHADLLNYIKSQLPQIQIIAVGDMMQKVYDRTTLRADEYINLLLGEHKKLSFSLCFRLSADHAAMLGRVWGKKIVGVNNDCLVEKMTTDEAIKIMKDRAPKDILCLGPRHSISPLLNHLEQNYPEKFNKSTVYASIADSDMKLKPKEGSAIFTTFDSCKGLERDYCFVVDFTESAWEYRLSKTELPYNILRNIFCVAASRGKKRLIFICDGEPLLSEESLSTKRETKQRRMDCDISKMFDFKYQEDVEECYSLLKITHQEVSDHSVISISNRDENIDLSPCIGIYQEASYFKKYDIDHKILFSIRLSSWDKEERRRKEQEYLSQKNQLSFEEKILYSTALETKQDRYRNQVSVPFVNEKEKRQLSDRLSTLFTREEEEQTICSIPFGYNQEEERCFIAYGMTDVIKDGVVYELKFVSELQHVHFLQCACYVVAMNLKQGVLWNTRNNERFTIEIPDKSAFLDAVAKTITKREIPRYFKTCEKVHADVRSLLCHPSSGTPQKRISHASQPIAVIDVETNLNQQVMSIGVTIASHRNYQPIVSQYYVITPCYQKPSIYSHALFHPRASKPIIKTHNEVLQDIKQLFVEYGVCALFAYNASFDYRNLPELSDYPWYDIMKIAAYKQHNRKISENAELCKTGRLKKYNLVEVLSLLRGKTYNETHNAVLDSLDELEVMQLLALPIGYYEQARINDQQQISFSLKNLDIEDSKENFEPRFASRQQPRCEQKIDSPISASARTCNEEKKSGVGHSSSLEKTFFQHSFEDADAGNQKEKDDGTHSAEKSGDNSESEYCTVDEAATRLHVSATTVRNRLCNGTLQGRCDTFPYLVSKADIDRCLREEKEARAKYLTNEEAAAMLHISVSTLRNWKRNGRLDKCIDGTNQVLRIPLLLYIAKQEELKRQSEESFRKAMVAGVIIAVVAVVILIIFFSTL